MLHRLHPRAIVVHASDVPQDFFLVFLFTGTLPRGLGMVSMDPISVFRSWLLLTCAGDGTAVKLHYGIHTVPLVRREPQKSYIWDSGSLIKKSGAMRHYRWEIAGLIDGKPGSSDRDG